jgi:hypothetical protein
MIFRHRLKLNRWPTKSSQGNGGELLVSGFQITVVCSVNSSRQLKKERVHEIINNLMFLTSG